MNPQQTSVQRPAVCLARISKPHGYRLEGDQVYLQAKFGILNQAANEHQWALQLWACPAPPTSAQDLAGQIVAEVALPPMSEAADETEHMDMSSFANTPAGGAAYFMALVLAAGRPGQFDEIHDIAVYPCQQHFLQPRMRGNISYRIDGNRVHLLVERIENPRSEANLSGTLALELWALPAPYSGGAFEGQILAGTVIGTVSGQNEVASSAHELPFSPPTSGTWHFVLMLREWTAAGYVTRDFTNFQKPMVYNPPPAIVSPKHEAAVPAETELAKPSDVTETAPQPAAPTPAVKASAGRAKVPAEKASVAPARVPAKKTQTRTATSRQRSRKPRSAS